MKDYETRRKWKPGIKKEKNRKKTKASKTEQIKEQNKKGKHKLPK